jgi:DNA mismatch repair protein MutL
MPIQILPDALVARIAAGEVVERPASVVKEMVENAIDAGATEIKVECLEGGRRLIRISDNGHGIRSNEAALAFAHHATSKLSNEHDLDHIGTLGFRGEALASIASVSTLACVTRHRDEANGSLIQIDNSQLVRQEAIGRPHGTTMTIEHLFGKVPARLKFLKSNITERGHIDGIVTRYALAYPHIRFALTHDGRTTLQTNGSGDVRDVLIETMGADDVDKMVAIQRDETQAITVEGYIGLPTINHATRGKITVFVNGRPVQDVRLATAVIQGYHTLLMVGRYPVAVIMVQVPSADVDVNVHPAKAEVRFRDANAVFSAVQRAVRKTLLTHMQPPEPPVSDLGAALAAGNLTRADDESSIIVPTRGAPTLPPPNAPTAPPIHQPALSGSHSWERVGIARNAPEPHATSPAAQPIPQTQVSTPQPSGNLPALRILGQLAATYIIAEGPEGLYLIDQHAAHERILFERLMAQHDLGSVVSQPLLDPAPVDIPLDRAHLLDGNLDALRDIGFEIDHFGGTTYLVRAVPQLMLQDDIAAALREIVAEFEEDKAPLRKEIEAKALRRVCKRMAIKAGRVLPLAEMQALVRDLEACESPRTCPHGRPTMIQISTGQLEKLFGRLG